MALDTAPPAPGDQRILVFDDDEDSVAVLVDLLTDEGFAVRTATSGEQAVRCLESEAFSLVLADYVVGAKHASRATAQRLLEAAGPTPVGCITGWPLPDTERSRYAFVVTKPFGIEDLLAQIGRVVTSQRGDPAALDLMRRYFQALTDRDWEALGALCTEEVRYRLPGDHALSKTIVGRAALKQYAAGVFGLFPEPAFELAQVSWVPRGAVARYIGSWQPPGGPRVQQDGAVLFAFQAGRIAEIGVRVDVRRLLAPAAGPHAAATVATTEKGPTAPGSS